MICNFTLRGQRHALSKRQEEGGGAIVLELGSRHEYWENCHITVGGEGTDKYTKHRVVAII